MPQKVKKGKQPNITPQTLEQFLVGVRTISIAYYSIPRHQFEDAKKLLQGYLLTGTVGNGVEFNLSHQNARDFIELIDAILGIHDVVEGIDKE